MLSVMAASARKRFPATRSTAVKNTSNSSGATTHPCLRPYPTSNLSEHSPLSNRTHACMPSWNWRVTASILGGTPKRARTSHIRVDIVWRNKYSIRNPWNSRVHWLDPPIIEFCLLRILVFIPYAWSTSSTRDAFYDERSRV